MGIHGLAFASIKGSFKAKTGPDAVDEQKSCQALPTALLLKSGADTGKCRARSGVSHGDVRDVGAFCLAGRHAPRTFRWRMAAVPAPESADMGVKSGLDHGHMRGKPGAGQDHVRVVGAGLMPPCRHDALIETGLYRTVSLGAADLRTGGGSRHE